MLVPSSINSVAFSPDGSNLASASDDGMVRLAVGVEDVDDLIDDIDQALRV